MKGFAALAALALVLLGTAAGPARAASPNVVISEFRFRGTNGASDEFIELYNRSDVPEPIGGWLIPGGKSAGTVSTRVTISTGGLRGAGCHFLVTNSTAGAYSGGVAGDQTCSTGVT